jgi:hypothetical protein
MVSGTTEKLLEEIYADTRVTPGEVRQLRLAVDEANARFVDQLGHEGVFDALQKSFDVTTQLVQESILKVKREDYTDTALAVLIALIEANIALLQANVDAFGE